MRKIKRIEKPRFLPKFRMPSISFIIILFIFALTCQLLSMKANASLSLEHLETCGTCGITKENLNDDDWLVDFTPDEFYESLSKNSREFYKKCITEMYKSQYKTEPERIRNMCFCSANAKTQRETITALEMKFKTLSPSGNIIEVPIVGGDFWVIYDDNTRKKGRGCYVRGPTFTSAKERCENYNYFSKAGTIFPYHLDKEKECN